MAAIQTFFKGNDSKLKTFEMCPVTSNLGRPAFPPLPLCLRDRASVNGEAPRQIMKVRSFAPKRDPPNSSPASQTGATLARIM